MTSVDIKALKTIEDIKKSYEKLSIEEETVNQELDFLLKQEEGLKVSLSSLADLKPVYETSNKNAAKLFSRIDFTVKLADKVSAKVKKLHVAQSRVTQCQLRVNDLIDLKVSASNVLIMIQEENYEQAAAFIHRFLTMDKDIIKASRVSEGVSSLESAIKTLEEGEKKLKDILCSKFDEALSSSDENEKSVFLERYFKLFPLLLLHDEGLKQLITHLTRLISKSLRQPSQQPHKNEVHFKHNGFFANRLTFLFESLASNLEIYSPMIETYYGHGFHLTVLCGLQKEIDELSKGILTEFYEKREIGVIVESLRECLRIQSLKSSDSKVIPKDIDGLLSEMALLQSRTELYFRFVRKKVKADIECSKMSEESHKAFSNLDECISSSILFHEMQNLLSDYIVLEQYFMTENIKEIIEKSGEDSQENSVLPLLIDDIFFILKKSIIRSLSTQNIDGFCTIVNLACTSLETDLYSLIQQQLKLGFSSGILDQAYNVIQTSFSQGKLQGNDNERQKALFLIYLNNAEISMEYISTLHSSLVIDLQAMSGKQSTYSKDKMDNCLAGLPAAGTKFRLLLSNGLSQLSKSVFRLRLSLQLNSFPSHNISESEYLYNEANDPFLQSLILTLKHVADSFKNSLTSSNYEAFMTSLSSEISYNLESSLIKSSFSRLGALQFDKELRSLISFLSSVTNWRIRDKYARLSVIATLLNLETLSEVTDLSISSLPFSPSEIKSFLRLRVDFSREEIKRLKL